MTLAKRWKKLMFNYHMMKIRMRLSYRRQTLEMFLGYAGELTREHNSLMYLIRERNGIPHES